MLVIDRFHEYKLYITTIISLYINKLWSDPNIIQSLAEILFCNQIRVGLNILIID